MRYSEDDGDLRLNGDRLMCDVLAEFEIRNPQFAGTGASQLVGFCVLKRDIQISYEPVTEVAEIAFLFTESCRNVIRGKLAVPEQIASGLAGLQLQIAFGDQNSSNQDSFNSKNIFSFLPQALFPSANPNQLKSLLDVCKAHWLQRSGMPVVQAKKEYISIVSKLPLFGNPMFVVEQKRKPKSAVLVFHPNSIQILDQSTPVSESENE